MSADINVQDLYGIGKRYDVGCSQGQRVVVVIRKDGGRELYSFEKDAKEPTAVISLSDEQARHLGLILTGAFLDSSD
jgi:K+/H+ antiporter YhaU regulatory subunit KhtT